MVLISSYLIFSSALLASSRRGRTLERSFSQLSLRLVASWRCWLVSFSSSSQTFLCSKAVCWLLYRFASMRVFCLVFSSRTGTSSSNLVYMSCTWSSVDSSFVSPFSYLAIWEIIMSCLCECSDLKIYRSSR